MPLRERSTAEVYWRQRVPLASDSDCDGRSGAEGPPSAERRRQSRYVSNCSARRRQATSSASLEFEKSLEAGERRSVVDESPR